MPPTPPSSLPAWAWYLADLYNGYMLPYLPDSVKALSSHLTPLVTSTLSAASNGDIVSLAAFLLTVYLSLKIADYIRRSIVTWVVFLVKILLVLVVINSVFYVNRNGWHKALSDAEWVFELLWGLVEERMNGHGEGGDNRTGWYGSSGRDGHWSAYGGGRQQVPVGRGSKGKAGWS